MTSGSYIYPSASGFRVTNSSDTYTFKTTDDQFTTTLPSLITGTLTNTIDASAKLQIDSTTLGLLPPRMTTTQKNAISSPAEGLVVYDLTLRKLCVYTTAWETVTSS